MNSRDDLNLQTLTKRLIQCEQEKFMQQQENEYLNRELQHIEKKYDKLKEHYKVAHDERENLMFMSKLDMIKLDHLLQQFWFMKHEAESLPNYPDVKKQFALLQKKHDEQFEEFEKSRRLQSNCGKYPNWI